jgi:excisionase family DNA binding protein
LEKLAYVFRERPLLREARMAQKFLSLEEAADQLGISKDRLSELRQANKVTGYKDGASWKFRPEAIEKLATEGIPDIDPQPSGLSLDLDDDYKFSPEATPPPAKAPAAKAPAAETPAANESDLQLADEIPLADDEPPAPKAAPAASAPDSDLNLDNEELVAGPASDLSLDEVDEPTVAGLDEGSDDALALDTDDSIDINTDSILLSEAELGESPPRPPSTIIGKGELDMDADLDLSPLDKGAGPASDVKLADSDLLPVGGEDIGLDLSDPSGDFSGLEELEVDLEAESSRIMSPEDIAKAQAAAKAASSKKKKSAASSGLSDLELAPSSSIATSDIGLGKEDGSGTGLTGLSALELDDDEDEGVLGDGSDVTLSGESSGINIISPSDSGLALDEVPLELSGSAPIGSSLDLGSSVSLDDSGLDQMSISGIGMASKVGEFQLTPLGEEDADEEKDSSQVIALDELSEEGGGAALEASLGDAGMMAEDFGVGLAPGTVPVGVPAGAETPFSIWNVLALSACLMFISLCGMMTYDLLRNIWSWDGVTTLNSTLLQALNPFLGR